METQRVTITIQRGTRQDRFELQAGTLRIGSASHCDVRLAPDEAAPEQLLLAQDARGLSLRALSQEPAVRLHGAALTQALIQSEALLEVGSLVLHVQLSQAQARVDPHGALRKNARLLAMLIGIAILAYSLLNEPASASPLERPVQPPQLFGLASVGCREHEPALARVFAREQLAAAESKRERAPFSARDGVAAVPLYLSAAACFRVARESDPARAAGAEAARLAAELEQTVHAHQARLEWFLTRTRYAAAAEEVARLRELVAERGDAYANWLAAVERELPRALASQEAVSP